MGARWDSGLWGQRGDFTSSALTQQFPFSSSSSGLGGVSLGVFPRSEWAPGLGSGSGISLSDPKETPLAAWIPLSLFQRPGRETWWVGVPTQ